MIGEKISLIVNGKPRDLEASATIPALLEVIGVDRRLVAVALNGEVVPRDRHEATLLHDGDRVEVVRMVGGG